MNTPTVIYVLFESEGMYDDYTECALEASFSREAFDKRVAERNTENKGKDAYGTKDLDVREVPFTA